ncbi:MAG: cobaltochelatase subunit CobT [Alphaproteobacteria bacterium]|nr:cobaltochelatase subunit CobT [Alphaproteobacteria bacterium]
MTTDAAAERVKHALAATLRAVGKAPAVEVVYTAAPSRLTGKTAFLQVAAPAAVRPLDAALRADADMLALRLRYHEPRLVSPASDLAAPILQGFEEARLEALGSETFAGIAGNLSKRRAAQTELVRDTDLFNNHQTGLPLAVRYLLSEHAAELPVPASAETFVRHWARLLHRRGKLSIEALAAVRDNQAAFQKLAAAAVERLLTLPDDGDEEDITTSDAAPDDAPQQNDGETAPTESESSQPQEDNKTDEQLTEAQQQVSSTAVPAAPEDTLDQGLPAEIPAASSAADSGKGAELRSYGVFTTTYDTTASADTLATADELIQLRAQLDRQLIPYQNLIHRLANRLQRLLLALQQTDWRFDQDEGIINNARLPRLVTDPSNTAIFKAEQRGKYRDTVVTLLLDNSGSMRGRPIATTALTADILARTLERVQVKVEILGFTTNTWKGGRAREDWIKAGKPPQSGRMNELRHIIYKPAAVPWRRVKNNLALMLKEGLLKENIDGEALLWAYRRLLARPEPRRILLILSDGAPVDDATISANGAGYLEAHLRGVIGQIERDKRLELSAIGIGHDVSRYYSNAVLIESVEDLAGSLIGHLETLFR